MYDNVIVVATDKTIGVDGTVFKFQDSFPETDFWALQWRDGKGILEDLEYKNHEMEYSKLEPFIKLWEAKKQEFDKEEQEKLDYLNSTEYKAECIRQKRDSLLYKTDKYLMPDYPIEEPQIQLVKQYREELRNITTKKGFPWDGGGDQTPWPVFPI